MTEVDEYEIKDVGTISPIGSDLTPDKSREEVKEWIRDYFKYNEGEVESGVLWKIFKSQLGANNITPWAVALEELSEEGKIMEYGFDIDEEEKIRWMGD